MIGYMGWKGKMNRPQASAYTATDKSFGYFTLSSMQAMRVAFDLLLNVAATL